MLAVLTDVVLPTFFTACALFATGVLIATLRTFGAEFREIRMQLNASAETREFAVRLATTEARPYLPISRRTTIRRPAGPAPRARSSAQRAAA